jgi:hypothetical protein
MQYLFMSERFSDTDELYRTPVSRIRKVIYLVV